MSAINENVTEKVDITDVELQNALQGNYKSVGRIWAMKYLFQCDVTDNGIPTDSNQTEAPQDEIITEGENPKDDTIYDLFWEQIENIFWEQIKCHELMPSQHFFKMVEKQIQDVQKSIDENIEQFNSFLKNAQRHTEEMIKNIQDNENENGIENVIDTEMVLNMCAKTWDDQCIKNIDCSVIRASLFELKNCLDIPSVFLVSDVTIIKIFSSDNLQMFIGCISNAVVNKLFFKRAKRCADKIIKGVCEKEIEIDKMLGDNAEKWDIQRMDVVDRNIIRAALFEMKFCADTPPVVCITEAIKISKIFGSENSQSFINGILNAIMKNMYPNIKKKGKKYIASKKES